MKKSINVNKMQNGIISNTSTVALNCIYSQDGAIAQHFNADDQILSTDGREIPNHWCKVNNSTPLNHSSIISDKMLNET